MTIRTIFEDDAARQTHLDEIQAAKTQAIADALCDAADQLEAQANAHPANNLPETFIEAHEQIKQLRRDERWLRARGVAIRAAAQ